MFLLNTKLKENHGGPFEFLELFTNNRIEALVPESTFLLFEKLTLKIIQGGYLLLIFWKG